MKIPLRFAAIGVFTLALTGCYNNPDISGRDPKITDLPTHNGPSSGPGKAAGGATAGPATPGAEPHAAKPAARGAHADAPVEKTGPAVERK